MSRKYSKSVLMAVMSAGAAMFTQGTAFAADDAPPDRRIGYALYEYEWALYQTPDGQTECPQGLNRNGPREQFQVLFPNNGTKRKLMDTQLAREAEIWWPKASSEPYDYKEAQGTVAPGLNLDNKIGANDFTSPEGEKGIDNNMYRALGCSAAYRGPDGPIMWLTNLGLKNSLNDRVVIELTDVDSLTNDDDVTLTTFRGRDQLLIDAVGNPLASGTQRIDTRWGKKYIYKAKGHIKAGVLTTEPIDFAFPANRSTDTATSQYIRGMRLRLKLTPDRAEGLMGGYTDVDEFYRQVNKAYSTHHISNGQVSSQSLYQSLHHLADGYPDPETGQNTAISSALKVFFTQVFVQHPEQTKEIASKDSTTHSATTKDMGASRR